MDFRFKMTVLMQIHLLSLEKISAEFRFLGVRRSDKKHLIFLDKVISV